MRLSFVLLLLVGGVARAQDSAAAAAAAPVVPDPADTLLRRAEQMVYEGHAAAGRAIIDSVLAATATGTPQYAEVLFTKAVVAPTAFEAERDFQRVIVEYPSSPRADDALLRIAQEEIARGDKEAARQHLTRLDRDRPPSSTWPRANLSVARAWFEVGDPVHACAALAVAHSDTPSSAVELIHQLDYAAQPCAGLPVAATRTVPPVPATASVPAPAPSTPPQTPAPTPTVSTPAPTPVVSTPAPAPAVTNPTTVAPTPRPPASTPAGKYTVQVAAYDTRGAAEALASKLRERGYESRVWGTAAPFRVRIGHYATRAAAERELSALQAKQMSGFVAASEPAN
jgi:cell division septation protein DedD